MKIRTVIVDDEDLQRSALKYKINGLNVDVIDVVGEAFSVRSAISIIEETSPDLVFLDIEIIGGTGFDVLDHFEDPSFMVIFVTSYPEFGVKAFRYKALDYILKPVNPADLGEAITRVLQHSTVNRTFSREINEYGSSHNLALSSGKTIRIVPCEQIMYCEAQGNYIHIHFINGEVELVTQQLGSLEEMLCSTCFMRIHRSYIINMNYVAEIIPKTKTCSVILSGKNEKNILSPGIELEVSSYYRASVLQYYNVKSK